MIPNYLILHHSGTTDGRTFSWPAIRAYHKSWRINGQSVPPEQARMLLASGRQVERPWLDIGYHLGIELVGDHFEVVVGRMFDQTGAHCSGQRMNHCSLGICVVGNFDSTPVPPAQWALAVRLVSALVVVLRIPAANVLGHREVMADGRSCPGRLFDMDQFRREVRQ